MTAFFDLPHLECADDHPKIIRRLIKFISKTYLVDICEDHKNLPEFQGEEINV